MVKSCKNCGTELNGTYVHNAVFCRSGECQAARKEAESARKAANHASNRELIKERRIKYRKEKKSELVYAARERARGMKNRKISGDSDAVKKVYAFRDRLNSIFVNRKFVVDHIVPLKGKNVSGLHVSWNLRVVPFEENAQKGAKHA